MNFLAFFKKIHAKFNPPPPTQIQKNSHNLKKSTFCHSKRVPKIHEFMEKCLEFMVSSPIGLSITNQYFFNNN
ncbi:hypothetical protein [Campylobacter troglodytis]|uniref:hypothetical protein n=1 Tax=Campylobacter troglodytis TaxID=654363 RepID=UPI00115AF932|nr:hypothetical protein [Campylobacter troglodytis]TQR56604.1 hypothetical protein DMC01_09105 [Campylobacter troglodytis]